MLQFNINVPSSVYAKYYFGLRTLAEANDFTFLAEPLSKERAQKLEVSIIKMKSSGISEQSFLTFNGFDSVVCIV